VSRIKVNFAWIFNSLSGVQPASELDDNFDAVPGGSITVGARVLAASYAMNADDEYSFLLCVPTNNMNVTLPPSPNTDSSFFISNQSTTKNVTLMGTVTIGGQVTTNPVFPGDFGPLNNVTGGFVVYDGSTWSVYPQFFMASTPKFGTVAVTEGDESVTITFPFAYGDTDYRILSPSVDWNTGTWISNKTAAGFTINFATPVPVGGGNVDWRTDE
jgi:hypothetical protein